MRIFSRLYTHTLKWSSHKHAPYYLAAVSFAESSFFPIPPDVMLVSMGLAKPKSSLQYAFIATIFSVLGGCFGYLLGYYFIEIIEPMLMQSSYHDMYQNAQYWFDKWGIWIIFVASFTPIPYKIFTISAGATHMLLMPFILASIVGRGLRYFMVSGFLYFFGARFEKHFRRWIDWIGWAVLVACVIYLLAGCGGSDALAPVEESNWYQSNLSKTTHKVKRGETLYAIAFQYEKDYEMLARANHLQAPYTLHVGQEIKLTAPKAEEPLFTAPSLPDILPSEAWIWPVKGSIKTYFSPKRGQKGVNIKGQKGGKVHAARAGVVAYAGSGIPGYGNLVILKHDKRFLTAYGFNQSLMVREGQSIAKGQAIAKQGIVNRQYYGVHFEVRKSGEPVNPLNYLKKNT